MPGLTNWECGNSRIALVGHHPCPVKANFRKVSSSSSGNAVLLIKLHKTLKWNPRIDKITWFCGIIFIFFFRISYFFEIITAQCDGMVKLPDLSIPEDSAQIFLEKWCSFWFNGSKVYWETVGSGAGHPSPTGMEQGDRDSNGSPCTRGHPQ